ncbi:MAG: hypothetical protein AAGN82_01340 [Myxococcota bacterium]
MRIVPSVSCWFVLTLGSLAACDPPAPPAPGPTPTAASSQPASSGSAVAASGRPDGPAAAAKPKTSPALNWTKPEAWNKVDHPSRMRLATYRVEGEAGPAEMSVTQVGGGVAANITRWEGQFDGGPKAKTEEREVAGQKVTVVSIEGTYMGGMRPAMGLKPKPTENAALLAAIVHTEPAHFFKMTGPKTTVDAAREGFEELVRSFEAKP